MKKVAAFISIPKCASKSSLVIFQLGKNRDNDADDKNNVYHENHQRLCVMEKKYNLTKLFVFTFVRHPYARTRSWYLFHKRKKIPMYMSMSLNEWVRRGCRTHFKVQNGTNWKRVGKSPLLQCNFTEAKKAVDFVGKLEHFERDAKRVIKKLNALFSAAGIRKKIAYRPVIKQRSGPSSAVLSQASKDKIYALFRKDFDRFNYEK